MAKTPEYALSTDCFDISVILEPIFNLAREFSLWEPNLGWGCPHSFMYDPASKIKEYPILPPRRYGFKCLLVSVFLSLRAVQHGNSSYFGCNFHFCVWLWPQYCTDLCDWLSDFICVWSLLLCLLTSVFY